jgi:hypothetical protein
MRLNVIICKKPLRENWKWFSARLKPFESIHTQWESVSCRGFGFWANWTTFKFNWKCWLTVNDPNLPLTRTRHGEHPSLSPSLPAIHRTPTATLPSPPSTALTASTLTNEDPNGHLGELLVCSASSVGAALNNLLIAWSRKTQPTTMAWMHYIPADTTHPFLQSFGLLSHGHGRGVWEC